MSDGKRDLEGLISSYFDQTISESDFCLLEEYIQTDSSVATLFYEHARLHVLLHRIGVVSGEEEKDADELQMPSKKESFRPKKKRWFALAASVLLVIGVTLLVVPSEAYSPYLIPKGNNITITRDGQIIVVTNSFMLVQNDQIHIPTNAEADVVWDDERHISLLGYTISRCGGKNQFLKRRLRLFLETGHAIVHHAGNRQPLHIGTPHIVDTPVYQSAVSFKVNDSNSHLKVAHGALVVQSRATGQVHSMAMGDEVTIVH